MSRDRIGLGEAAAEVAWAFYKGYLISKFAVVPLLRKTPWWPHPAPVEVPKVEPLKTDPNDRTVYRRNVPGVLRRIALRCPTELMGRHHLHFCEIPIVTYETDFVRLAWEYDTAEPCLHKLIYDGIASDAAC